MLPVTAKEDKSKAALAIYIAAKDAGFTCSSLLTRQNTLVLKFLGNRDGK